MRDDENFRRAWQRSVAAAGRNPRTGRWWPPWKIWRPTSVLRSVLRRFTSETGRAAGQKRSHAKTVSCRQNGLLGARYGYLGARYGVLGPAAKHAKSTGRARHDHEPR